METDGRRGRLLRGKGKGEGVCSNAGKRQPKGTSEGGKTPRDGRPVSTTVMNAQKKMTEHHDRIKLQAADLWKRLDNPAFDSPLGPESGFAAEAIAIAKRGRRATTESCIVGSMATKRAIRDYERSAKNHGATDEEILRLREYPEAVARYVAVANRVKKKEAYPETAIRRPAKSRCGPSKSPG